MTRVFPKWRNKTEALPWMMKTANASAEKQDYKHQAGSQESSDNENENTVTLGQHHFRGVSHKNSW